LAIFESRGGLRLRRPTAFQPLGIASVVSLYLIARHSQWVTPVFDNSFSFHQHNGKTTVTSLFFINIMERRKADIFSTFIFNNLAKICLNFEPFFFRAAIRRDLSNYIFFNDIGFRGFFTIYG